MPLADGIHVAPPSVDLNTPPGSTPANSVEDEPGSIASALTQGPKSPSISAHVAPPSVLLKAPPVSVEKYTVAGAPGSMAMAVAVFPPGGLRPVSCHLAPPSTLLNAATVEPLYVPA